MNPCKFILFALFLFIGLNFNIYTIASSDFKNSHVRTAENSKWGFYGHKLINKHAIYILPPEMIVFYKHHINYIESKAVNPDMRRYILKEEAPRHYIDLDHYGDSAHFLPRFWNKAVDKYSEDTLLSRGIVPWHVQNVLHWLTLAFQKHDVESILRLSSDLGHYIADANVPLHTTSNYNGQFSNQHGIHGFWESRLPELYGGNYDRFVGKAEYIKHPHEVIWEAVFHANSLLTIVFQEEINTTRLFPDNKKYAYEKRGDVLVRTYSEAFSFRYHQAMEGMVEAQMKKSIKMLGDFWYTAWINAGQPDLNALISQEYIDQDTTKYEPTDIQLRNHEAIETIGSIIKN